MKTRKLLRVTLIIFVVFALGGCAANSSRRRAMEVAKREAARQGWKDFKVGVVFEHEGNWHVEIFSLPYTYGSSRFFEVSKNGELIDILPGL